MPKVPQSRRDDRLEKCRKATELLSANFALDTTLGQLSTILLGRPSSGAVGASSPGADEEAKRPVTPTKDPVPESLLPVLALTPIATAPAVRDTRHRDCVEAFVALWREKRGGEYRVIGARDGSMVKTLLQTVPDLTVQEFRRRAEHALGDEWFRRNGSIAVLCSQWNKWEPPAQRGPGPAGRIFAGLDASGRAVYREAP
jgi:hypothetical protein